MTMDSTPVACSLDNVALSQRRARWQALAARTTTDVSQAAHGLRLTFGDAPGVASELGELAALERECCPFAEWSVSTGPGQLVLDIRGGSPEAVAAIRAMFATPW
jgi:hypothetical protein